MTTMLKTVCSGCMTDVAVDRRNGVVTAVTPAKRKATGRVYYMEGDKELAMWECPACGYSDSHIDYLD
jgi:hypothetical protein